ncbi:MAG: family 1 encapsulin nanocompartment shell protein [Byssovorax sp.]
MDLLKRKLAPILPEAWTLIDDEARRVLKLNLAGRKVVDFRGPHGWKFAAVSTGRLQLLPDQPIKDVSVGVRTVQPLIEIRTPMVLDIMELDTITRGAENPDLDPVVQAAERMARLEDQAIFHGYPAGGIVGLIEASPHAPVRVSTVADWPKAVVQAKEVLRAAGVGGPYALVLGPRAYDELSAASEDGYPLRKRIERSLIDGPFVWAPALTGAVLMSTRGGDFELTVGQDLSIGYAYHEKHQVELYLTESFTFRVLEPKAAVWLQSA